MERLRINIDRKGVISKIPDNELQNKSGRYYFEQGIKASYPSVYFSPIDLNIEHQHVVYPIEPTIRVSLRTEKSQGLPNGLLILNYNLTSIFEDLNQLSNEQLPLYMANQEGFWFIHPNKEYTWGHSLDQPHHNAKENESNWWKLLQQQDVRVGFQLSNAIYSSSKITINNQQNIRSSITPRTLYFWVKSPFHFLSAISYTLLIQIGLTLIATLTIGRWFINREHRYQLNQLNLMLQLKDEKQSLDQLNIELKKTIEEQNLLQNELAESKKLSSLGMVVAGVAHEINTPAGGALVVTSSLQQNLEQLKQQIETGLTKNDLFSFLDKNEEGLKIAKTNLEKISLLVSSFKRLAVDRSVEDPSHFQLDIVIDDLFVLLKTQLKNTKIQLQKDIQPDLELFSYPGLISQILQNLVLNAAKHAFDSREAGQILVSAHDDRQDNIILRISDNGSGIPESIHHNLFDPFVTTARNKGNTGLGLHLVHQWVTQILKGQIRFRTASESGTEFIIVIKKDISRSSDDNTPDLQEDTTS